MPDELNTSSHRYYQRQNNYLLTRDSFSRDVMRDAATLSFDSSIGARLFSVPGSRGFFYDFSDYSTQFTDTAGTTPVTGTGQSLALVLDESQGLTPGPELVTNGDFSSAVGWTLQTGWTIGSGVLSGNVAAAAFANAGTSVSFVAGRAYQITFTITSYTSGAVRSRISGGTDVFSATDRASVGTFTDTLVAVAGNNTINMQARSAGFVGTIDNISVREIPGNHATQATAGSRPLTTTIGAGFRGIQFDGVDDFLQTAAIDFAGAESLGPELVTNGDFSSGTTTGWTPQSGATLSIVSGAMRVLDDGVDAAAARAYQVITTVVGRTYKLSGAVIAGSTTSGIFAASPNTSFFGQPQTAVAAGASGSLIFTATTTSTNIILATNSLTAGIYADFDNVSVKEVLFAADKMTVVAGVRKLSDAATGTVVELSANPDTTNGSFGMRAPAGANSYVFRAFGTVGPVAVALTGFAAPESAVITGSGDISADSTVIRRNGAAGASLGTDLGTGNYSNSPVFIGRGFGGTTNPFNGILTFLCVINRVLTADDLALLETIANSRTGAY